jgi:hypothetical protein
MILFSIYVLFALREHPQAAYCAFCLGAGTIVRVRKVRVA